MNTLTIIRYFCFNKIEIDKFLVKCVILTTIINLIEIFLVLMHKKIAPEIFEYGCM